MLILNYMQIPLHFEPRQYQAEALQALEAGIAEVVWCWARRAGKDMTGFAYGIKEMIKQPMNVVLVFPTKKQGFDNFWTNIENDGFKTLDHIPKELIATQSNNPDNMKITLINGSTFSLLGAGDPETLRGANGKIYILSEFVDIPSGVLGVIRPIIAVNKGQIIIQSTPKIDGISGATFKNLFDRAMEHPRKFASRILATEYLTKEELEDVRQDYIAEYSNDFKFRQEFLCDWGQTSQTSYYGGVLKKLEDGGAIDLFPHDAAHPVYTAWDLGMSDMTAITFFQYFMVNNEPQVRIIDYYESNNLKNEAHVRFVQSKPYNIAWHFFPHDAKVRDSDAVERMEKIRNLGLTNSSILRREPKEDGIGRVVSQLGKAVIHAPMTLNLIKKLKLYKRKFNGITGDYEGPEHKTESHAADSIRYAFQAIELEFRPGTCEMYYSQSSEDDYYDSEMPNTNIYSPA